mgnify:FL=1
MEKIIEVSNLHKSYGPVKAVNGIDFTVKKGELFAFLGPNGAGKSTTIETICTLLKPGSGKVVVAGYELGKDDYKIRENIGVVFQYSVLDDLLTVEENLSLRAAFYGLYGRERKKALELAAKAAGIESFLKRPYGKLSGGQKRRTDIARALVNTPKVIFLDEPTTGLDPKTRKNVWQTIFSLQKQTQLTVFLTTHYMEEAVNADNIAIIDKGRIVATGAPALLKEKFSSDKLLLTPKNSNELGSVLDGYNLKYHKAGGQFILSLQNTLQALPILDSVRANIIGFQVITGNMDDVFVNITGKNMREDVAK